MATTVQPYDLKNIPKEQWEFFFFLLVSSSLWGILGKRKELNNGGVIFHREDCAPGMTGGQLVLMIEHEVSKHH